jgi:hypothetical protein
MYHTNPHTLEQLQAEIEVVAEEITDNMSHDTVDNFEVCLQQVHEIKGSILNLCTHEDHMHAN